MKKKERERVRKCSDNTYSKVGAFLLLLFLNKSFLIECELKTAKNHQLETIQLLSYVTISTAAINNYKINIISIL
jgi:hypothetical protein